MSARAPHLPHLLERTILTTFHSHFQANPQRCVALRGKSPHRTATRPCCWVAFVGHPSVSRRFHTSYSLRVVHRGGANPHQPTLCSTRNSWLFLSLPQLIAGSHRSWLEPVSMSNKDVYTRQPRHIYARPEEPADSSTPNPRRSWAAALLPEKVKKAARRASTPETYRSHNWPPQSKAPERVVGRPPIEWTASHSRQLIRLVIETDIPISDLPRVLADKSIGFEPS